MKLILSLIYIPLVSSWMTPLHRQSFHFRDQTRLLEGLEDDSDCFSWQDVYEFDAPLSHCEEQLFVAADWVKSMPCGSKLEDCDMPKALKVPGTHDGHATIKTDVMEFLGLRRPETLNAKVPKPYEP